MPYRKSPSGARASTADANTSTAGGWGGHTSEGRGRSVAEAATGGPGRRGSVTPGTGARGSLGGGPRPTNAFDGMPGALPGRGVGTGGEDGGRAGIDPESFLRESLSLKDLVSRAFMFNFSEAGVLGLGERKASVQVRFLYFFAIP